MKLVYYELKKIWTSGAVLKLVLFMLLISISIFLGELREDRTWLPEYLNYHKSADAIEKKELQRWLAQEEKELESQQAGKDEKRKALSYVEQEIEAITNYDAYREEIQRRYEESSNFSIFSDSDSIQTECRKRVAETYRKLQITAPMQLGAYRGIQKFLDFYGGDFLLVVFLIYLVSAVFLLEEKNGKLNFLYTMVRGKDLFAAKTAAVCISMTVVMGIIFGINLLAAEIIYGLPSLGAAVQSVPELYAVSYPWTIGQYLFCWFGLKLIAVLCLTAVAVLLMRWSASDVITAVGICIFLGGCIGCHSFLIGDGVQAVLRLWNPWSLLRGKNIIGTYELVCFSSGILEAVWGVPIFFLSALLLLWTAGKIKRLEKRFHVARRCEKIQKPQRLLFYEFKKLWIHQGGLALFCFCIIVQGSTVHQYRDYFGTEEYYYHQYIDRFGNQVTEDSAEKLAKETARLEQLQKALENETDFVRVYKLQKELECREGFEKYADRVAQLQQGEKENIILKDAQYRLLFENTEVSRMMVILLSLSMAFLIPGVFQKEKETGMDKLQKTAVKGGNSLWCSKIGALLSYVIVFVLVCAGFCWHKVISLYNLELEAPLNCLEIYWINRIFIPIKIAYWCGVVLQCVVAAAVIVILSVCAQRAKNRYAMTGLILSGSFVPTILSVTIPLKYLRWIHDALFIFTNENIFLWTILIVNVLTALRIMQKEKIR